MPRLNVHTILWLFLVVALCVGWRRDHRQLLAENHALHSQALKSALED
jgi:hypothetical protein